MMQTSRPEIALEKAKRLGAGEGEAVMWRIHSPSMAGSTNGYLFVASGPGEHPAGRPAAHRDCCRMISCWVRNGVLRPNFASESCPVKSTVKSRTRGSTRW